mmetsp:Transcript_8010/g.23695  ORF Transcript_8010/g.23695 Transcript_8010/m.23695 type:complete len:299 (-) Transcript_8010:628-1524(-)
MPLSLIAIAMTDHKQAEGGALALQLAKSTTPTLEDRRQPTDELVGEAAQGEKTPGGAVIHNLDLLEAVLLARHGATPRESHLPIATTAGPGTRELAWHVGEQAIRVSQQLERRVVLQGGSPGVGLIQIPPQQAILAVGHPHQPPPLRPLQLLHLPLLQPGASVGDVQTGRQCRGGRQRGGGLGASARILPDHEALHGRPAQLVPHRSHAPPTVALMKEYFVVPHVGRRGAPPGPHHRGGVPALLGRQRPLAQQVCLRCDGLQTGSTVGSSTPGRLLLSCQFQRAREHGLVAVAVVVRL